MGKRGPAPTPTPLLQLRGSWRANKNRNQPEPPQRMPRAPDFIRHRSDEYMAWKYLAERLHRLGLLTEIDRNALARYCVLWARWRKAEEFIEKHGDTHPVRKVIKDEQGNEKVVVLGFKPFPQVRLAGDLADRLLRLEQQFGLTPASRPQIQVPVKQAEDTSKARFFRDTR